MNPATGPQPAAIQEPPAIDTPSSPATGAAVFAVTIFLSAFLLFQVQLIMGKYILPWFGGMPAVWNTCMLVYQVLLLGGYAYAHAVSSRLERRAQARLHIALLAASLVLLLALAFLWRSPITPGADWKPRFDANPVGQIIVLLGASIALPFFLLSTTGPLLQSWFSRTFPGRSPYRLYALSNLGSLLGLLSYPFLVEWKLRLFQQAWMWTIGYVLFLVACGAAAWKLMRGAVQHASSGEAAEDAPLPGWGTRLLWLALATLGSVMLLAATNLISQEVAVIPLLWVLPLCLYLLSFILCFENERWYRRGFFHPFYAISAMLALEAWALGPNARLGAQIIVFSAAMFACCMVCHGELARLKPAARHLTSFYLLVSLGGALGGAFVVLVAPMIFSTVLEFQLALIGAGALAAVVLWRDRESWFYRHPAWMPLLLLMAALLLPYFRSLAPARWWYDLGHNPGYDAVVAAVGLLVLLVLLRSRKHPELRFHAAWVRGGAVVLLLVVGYLAYHETQEGNVVLARTRNFFGVKTVLDDGRGQRGLRHGRVMHGIQLQDPVLSREPSYYYRRLGGGGLALDHYPRLPQPDGSATPLRVGLVGLGIGTMAAYARPGDYYRFYEIDPQVLDLSLGSPPLFTYLHNSRGRVDVVLGDARLVLESEAERGELQQFDLLVLDAFSSDAIPVHLLTVEALELYRRHLRGPNSIIAVHISNRSLDLRPVTAALARRFGMAVLSVPASDSHWVLMSSNPEMLKNPAMTGRTRELPARGVLWTDDYSNLFAVLHLWTVR